MRSALILFECGGNPSKNHLKAYLQLLLGDCLLGVQDIILPDEYEVSGPKIGESFANKTNEQGELILE